MTTLREAAQQALEALEEYQEKGAPFMSCDAAADALRAALAEPVQEPVQEPMAWLTKPLTEEEIWALYLPLDDFERSDRIDFARAIERAHGIWGDE